MNPLNSTSSFALRFLARTLLAVSGCAWLPLAHADTTCGTGQTVQGDMGGGAPGTIAEVGTAAPHVGWYRIVFGWNAPNGDWYDPAQWNVRPQGSDARCQAPSRDSAPAKPAAGTAPSAPPPAAQGASSNAPTESTERCKRGARAVDRQNRAGTIEGENNGLCRFAREDGSRDWLLPWMLTAAGTTPDSKGGLTPGQYTCTTNGAGIFRIGIAADGSYTDRAGDSGRYRLNADGTLGFDSGSLRGYYGRTLPGGRFGLGSRPDSILATVCDRKS